MCTSIFRQSARRCDRVIQYDAPSAMLYIGLRSRESVESEEIAPGTSSTTAASSPT
ncbi:MAG: DUF2283 domain-containing protein [Chloroflexota bacterium]|nr:DUF2283 domain-containing protein [Chloroflexota bacterium]